ncbi:hypothetical protein AB0J83_38385 [Actinoplanes sp. NPDC049596]|uniref:hypothetical protein n=1 Tax=unclassified Actinoplanes TaxID=2626549 RepID=UPI003447F95A
MKPAIKEAADARPAENPSAGVRLRVLITRLGRAMVRKPLSTIDAIRHARENECERLRALDAKLPPMKPDDRRQFDGFCEAAARRRVRERWIFWIVQIVVGALVATLSAWLVATTVWSRPAALVGYGMAVATLTLPAAYSLRGGRLVLPSLMTAFAAVVCGAVWRGSAGAPWWDPRWMLHLPTGSGEQLATGVALGSALTVVLIIFALLSRVGLALIVRSRAGGGSLRVRAFDQLMRVIELLHQTDGPIEEDRRSKIAGSVRKAAFTLKVMGRGRSLREWFSPHGRELSKQQKELVGRLRKFNARLGKAKEDQELAALTGACLVGVCQDQLGDALPPLVKAEAKKREKRLGGNRFLREGRKIAGLIGPTVILLTLLHFEFPMPSAVVGVLATFCALVLVVGSFWSTYPEAGRFLRGLSRAARSVELVVAGARAALNSADPQSTATGTPAAPDQRPPSEDPGDAGDPTADGTA